ncbi:MAG: DUF1775 domain-containing protein [Thermoleophilia bacterium]|nr:DUF1775 domain-containing protein [Thermoleophilia bacterium]
MTRRLLAVAAAGGALFVPPASAHVTTRPEGVESGTTQRVVLDVPNERDGHETTRVALTVPSRLQIAGASAPDGWTVDVTGATAVWTGGRIGGTDVVGFPVELAATGPSANVPLDVRQRYEDGEEESWAPTLAILPAIAAAPKEHPRRALVASVIGILVVGGSLVALQRARRPPPPETGA